MKIFSAAQLQKADKITITNRNISSDILMEEAGKKVFDWLHSFLKGSGNPIYIFCGIGDNGGDGLVVGRHLVQHGYDVHIFVVNSSDNRSENFLKNYGRIKEATKDWPALMKGEADFPDIGAHVFIIDAIFGIGLNRPPAGWVKKLIQYLNHSKGTIISIDTPSGLFSDKPTADFDAVIKAAHTLTFQTGKLSFFLPETGKFVGNFDVLDIGLDTGFLESLKPLAQLITKKEAASLFKWRDNFSHKNTYGHALIVAGSYGKMGAAILSAKATYRAGAGLVTVFIPKCGYSILQTALPEAMTITDVETNYISEIDAGFEPEAIGIGMGIGTQKETLIAVKNLFAKTKLPMVVDADALNCISMDKTLLEVIPKNSILTPHPGELKRLIGDWKDDYEKLEKTKLFSKTHHVIVVIKGFYTISVIEENLYINTTGNPGMATAGSGDVLSGILTGMLSQGLDPLVATVYGVFLHGLAGDICANKMGYEAMMAGDIIENLGFAFLNLTTPEPPQK